MFRVIALYLVLLAQYVNAEPIEVEQLHLYADGLNIEGGIIPSQKLNPNQVWANLAVVLDRPVITGETLDTITKKNFYALKEASLLDYDEVNTNTAYAIILNYYLLHGRTVANKPDSSQVKILAHIHRNSSALNHFQLLKRILKPLLENRQLTEQKIDSDLLGSFYFKPTNTLIEFKKGFEGKSLDPSPDTDIIVSLSMVAGLNPSYRPGTLLIPARFLPYKVRASNIDFSNQYYVKNDLLRALPAILVVQPSHLVNEITTIRSENPEKLEHCARPLRFSDFRVSNILQADGYFYPKL